VQVYLTVRLTTPRLCQCTLESSSMALRRPRTWPSWLAGESGSDPIGESFGVRG